MPTPPPIPATTKTVGYFNNNDFPVYINDSSLDLRLIINKKGQYIRDSNGKKINDPIFDRFLGPKGLSKEEVTDGKQVPILYVRRPTTSSDVPGSPQVNPNSPDPSRSSVQGMTMAEARKRGLLGKSKALPENFGVEAQKAGAPPVALPSIEDALVESVAEGNASLRKSPAKPPVAQAPQPPIVPVVESTQIHTSIGDLPEPDLDSPSEDETDATDGIIESQAETPSSEPTADGPLFVSPSDGKIFKYRSQLQNHLKKKFPDDVDAVMAMYPETVRGKKA